MLFIYRLGLDLGEQISRAPGRNTGGSYDQWGMKTTSSFKVTGRHVLNLWRIMRSELDLTSYTLENVAFHLLHQRCVRISRCILTTQAERHRQDSLVQPSHPNRVV